MIQIIIFLIIFSFILSNRSFFKSKKSLEISLIVTIFFLMNSFIVSASWWEPEVPPSISYGQLNDSTYWKYDNNTEILSLKKGAIISVPNAIFGNLTINNTFIHTEVINYLVNGDLNISDCINFPDGSFVCGDTNQVGTLKSIIASNVGSEAPLITQNLNPYGTDGVYTQNAQLWLDSNGNTMASMRADGTFIMGGTQGQVRANTFQANRQGAPSYGVNYGNSLSNTGMYFDGTAPYYDDKLSFGVTGVRVGGFNDSGNFDVLGKILANDSTFTSGTDTAVINARFPTTDASTIGSMSMGKFGDSNNGVGLRFQQVEGTDRLIFRGSSTAGAMVWSQPESGATLYMDFGGPRQYTFNANRFAPATTSIDLGVVSQPWDNFYVNTINVTTINNGIISGNNTGDQNLSMYYNKTETENLIIEINNSIITNHNELNNLSWSEANHTMDADLDMNQNDIIDVDNITLNGTFRQGVDGNMFIYDINGEIHHINVDLNKFDELRANTFTTALNISTFYNSTGYYINISAEDGGKISFIGVSAGDAKSETFNESSYVLELTSGTNETPILNRVYAYITGGEPTWGVSITDISFPHAMASRVLVGESNEVPYSASLQEDGVNGFVKRTQRTFRKDGFKYESGLDYNATSEYVEIGDGNFINSIYDQYIEGGMNTSDGFYLVNGNEEYIWYNSFSDLDTYSDNNLIGNNRYVNGIIGLTPYDGHANIYLVLQSKPNTEYTSVINAYADNDNTLKVYPSLDYLKLNFLPIARVIFQEGGNLQILPNGYYAEDYRGGVAGGVSSGGGLSEADPIWTADKINYLTDTEINENYLKLSGENANQNIDIGTNDLIANNIQLIEGEGTSSLNSDNSIIYGYSGDVTSGLALGTVNNKGIFVGGYVNNGSFIKALKNGSMASGAAYDISNIIAGEEGSFAQGFANNGEISSYYYGSFAQGHANTGGLIFSASDGSFAQGYAINSGQINSIGSGTFAQGQVNGGQMLSSEVGSFAQGAVYSGGLMFANGDGAFAQGAVYTNGNILAPGNGAFAQGATQYATIRSYGFGSFAQGYADNNGIIEAELDGGFAQGFAEGGDILSQNFGSFAQGYAKDSLSEIKSSGKGSFAQGYTLNGTISATADNSAQFGEGTNSYSDSIQFGNAISIYEKTTTPPFTIPNGLIFSNSTNLFMKINGNEKEFLFNDSTVDLSEYYNKTSNINASNYNITTTGTGFFGNIGSSIIRITKGWFSDLDVENNLKIGQNITADNFQNVSIKGSNSEIEYSINGSSTIPYTKTIVLEEGNVSLSPTHPAHFRIHGAENTALSTSTSSGYQWSVGNGETDVANGVAICDGEIYFASLYCITSSTANSKIKVYVNKITSGCDVSSTGSSASSNYNDSCSIPFDKGDNLFFKTTASDGGSSYCTAYAYGRCY